MHHDGPALRLSASDLSRFLGCRHRTGLDLAVAKGKLQRPFTKADPLLEILIQRGYAHEAAYVERLRANGHTIVHVANESNVDSQDAFERTLEAMHDGADVIVQATLRNTQWLGKPDILQRVATPSALGNWSYEVADTKLARETKATTILQLSLYSHLLHEAQGQCPQHFHVVTPNPANAVETYRVDDFAAYFRLVRTQLIATLERGDEFIRLEYYPEPVEQCEVCDWNAICRSKRRADDHLSLVAGITRTQRRNLREENFSTLSALASMPVPVPFKPTRRSTGAYERVREQARLQKESAHLDTPLHELLTITEGQGLTRLPEPTAGDLFLDLEGDPFATEGGREYLFGVVTADGSYHSQWGTTDADERAAFEWFMDLVSTQTAAFPGMHVYHYAPYEPSAFKRLMGRYVTRERELDAMLRSGRFVDLYAVVRQALRAGVERYSIKNLEPMYSFTRRVPLPEARTALVAMECALELGQTNDIPRRVLDTVEGYNRDDCVSTLRLRNWLETLRSRVVESGTEVPRRTLEDDSAPATVDERAQAVDAMRTRLLANVPEQASERSPEQQGRWLLAYLLDYHRREDKSTWHELFRLADLPEEDLIDERDAVAGLQWKETVETVRNKKTGKPTGSVIDRYTYPAQEMEIGARCEVRGKDRKKFADVVHVDALHRTIDLRKGPAVAQEHPSALFAFDYVSSEGMEKALMRIASSVVAGEDRYRAARALLTTAPPRLSNTAFAMLPGESATAFAVRIAGSLHHTVLPVQGPPGAGKTYTGAHMICALVKSGKRVGVTANSHAVIRNLLEAVLQAAKETGAQAHIVRKVGKDEEVEDGNRIREVRSDADALTALANGDANIVGGTAWLWSNEAAADTVDVLFVDEAGQMPLANVVAVSQAASSIVLLGDPQQLEHVRKGSHPDGVGVSALQHLLGGGLTIPDGRGIFLPETWRMTPRLCAFTSEMFYERRLQSRPRLEYQRLQGVGALREQGLYFLPVVHEGNRNHAVEEIDAIDALVTQLTSNGACWIDSEEQKHPIRESDILVVAPYNAQVNRLRERFRDRNVAIGTVDKFQGQEAPVVIYSMTTSRPEDAPRGLEFLYSLNRLNVATSRAKCVAVLVSTPHLFEPECRTPRQMRLANALCRFAEMAVGV